jgi:hypothetical protein
MKINEFTGDRSGSALRAEIHNSSDGYRIEYYINNTFQQSETFHNKSIFYVEDAATNWISGIKVLNG